MFKVNNRNTKTRCEICSKLTIKTPEPHQWRRSGVFTIVKFEHISHLVLVLLLLTLSRKMSAVFLHLSLKHPERLVDCNSLTKFNLPLIFQDFKFGDFSLNAGK